MGDQAGRARAVLGRVKAVFSLRGKSEKERNIMLFAIEGIIYNLILYLSYNTNNNLYAQRLGANAFQLTFVSLLPNLIGVVVLIPSGIFADRMTNKRKMVIIAMMTMFSSLLLQACSPFFGDGRLAAFFIFLAFMGGAIAIYNSNWQAYFADVMPEDTRNRALSIKNRLIFIVGIVTPLMTGAILSSFVENESKIIVHQVFLFLSAGFALFQIFILGKVSGGEVTPRQKSSIKQTLITIKGLMKNKPFVIFVLIALFFYMSWHMDWTLYYLSQVQYLGANEAWLSYINISSALVQFIMIGFWSRFNERFGVRAGFIFGAAGLLISPFVVNVSVMVPAQYGLVTFIIIHAISNIPFALINLNSIQCLLQVIDPNNKALSVALYTILITLSNAIMPMVGVTLYTHLGENLQALMNTYWIILGIRVVTTLLVTGRWWMLRNQPK